MSLFQNSVSFKKPLINGDYRMKNLIRSSSVVFLTIFIFFIVACDDSNNNSVCKCRDGTMLKDAICDCNADDCNCIKIVEEKYRFSDGGWQNEFQDVAGAVSELDETTLTVSGTVSFSYSNVYTVEEGKDSTGSAVWAYLYDNSGKIGIVVLRKDGSIDVYLGQTRVNGYKHYYPDLDTSDMQNDRNGRAHKY